MIILNHIICEAMNERYVKAISAILNPKLYLVGPGQSLSKPNLFTDLALYLQTKSIICSTPIHGLNKLHPIEGRAWVKTLLTHHSNTSTQDYPKNTFSLGDTSM